MAKRQRNEFYAAGLPADKAAVDLVIKAELGAAIAKHLQGEGVSQSVAAERFGVPQPVLSRIASGHLDKLSMSYLWKLLYRMGHAVCARTGHHPDDTSVEIEGCRPVTAISAATMSNRINIQLTESVEPALLSPDITNWGNAPGNLAPIGLTNNRTGTNG